jgi:tetratricopeptide (TPR) repeat protein
VQHFSQLLEKYLPTEDRRISAMLGETEISLSLTYIQLGQADQALAVTERSLQWLLHEQYTHIFQVQAARGYALLSLGRFSEAKEVLTLALEAFLQMKNWRMTAFIYLFLAQAQRGLIVQGEPLAELE